MRQVNRKDVEYHVSSLGASEQSLKQDFAAQRCTSSSSAETCITYHAKDIYNEQCGRALDHQDHADEQDNNLLQWCATNYVV